MTGSPRLYLGGLKPHSPARPIGLQTADDQGHGDCEAYPDARELHVASDPRVGADQFRISLQLD